MKLFHRQIFVIGFLFLYFLLGVFIFRDYGISWDESFSRSNALLAYKYVTGESREFLRHGEKEYGTGFELPLVFAEKTFNITSPQQIYYTRHFFTFTLFFIGTIFFYLLAKSRFGANLALLGTLFLILSPRIFADSFYNSKDAVFLAAFTFAVYTMVRFLDKKSLKNAMIHAAAAAFAISIRMPAVLIVVLTLVGLAYDLVLSSKKDLKGIFKQALIFIFATLAFTVIFWPYLWTNPIGNLASAYYKFNHFEWNNTALYFGRFVPVVSEFHKTYPLVWIGMTTPLSYLALFFIGISVFGLNFIKKPVKYLKAHRNDLIFLLWFFLPLFTVIAFRSVLYDGWRHLYFIYPALILVGLIGLEFILKQKSIIKPVVLVLIALNLVNVSIFMVKNHPYQNLYFNSLANGAANAKKNFDLDYWGLTFRKGLEYIAENDKSSKIPVFFAHGSLQNIDILSDEDRKRFIVLTEPKGAKYVLTNYRWHPEDYPKNLKIIYEIKIDGVSVMAVLSRPPEGFRNEDFERR